jgi:hypothetical protein
VPLLEARKELLDFVHLILKDGIDLLDGARGGLEHDFKALVGSGEICCPSSMGRTVASSVMVM